MSDGYFRPAMELHKYRFVWPALLPLCIKHWAWVEKKIKLASLIPISRDMYFII
jgi:hypothetical protein